MICSELLIVEDPSTAHLYQAEARRLGLKPGPSAKYELLWNKNNFDKKLSKISFFQSLVNVLLYSSRFEK